MAASVVIYTEAGVPRRVEVQEADSPPATITSMTHANVYIRAGDIPEMTLTLPLDRFQIVSARAMSDGDTEPVVGNDNPTMQLPVQEPQAPAKEKGRR